MNKKPLIPKPRFGIIGHRGAGSEAPENTLASFKHAKTLGLNWVEFDTQLCSTGDWVVIHDETLERTTKGQGFVHQTSMETLKTLDAGSWFNPKFGAETVPSLSQVLSLLANLQLHPNIEIKSMPELNMSVASFLQVVKSSWPANLPPPLISSFDRGILQRVQRLAPQYPLGYLVENPTLETCQEMEKFQFFSLHCDYTQIDEKMLDKLLSYDFPLLLYTINDQSLAESYWDRGVSAIFTDYPTEVRNADK